MSASAAVSEAHVASFHAVRPRLFGIAYRVLGSRTEADDVVQEAWVRWQRTDRDAVRDVPAFLAAATMRLAINVTQSARARRETHPGTCLPEPVDVDADPAHSAERADALERAVLTLLERLSATERAAYVLREAFDYPYRRIADVLATSEPNARQLVTRARLRLAGERRNEVTADEHRRFVEAFADAAQTGELAALEQRLAGDAGLRRSGDLLHLGAERQRRRERAGQLVAIGRAA
jgi:RNA polymerase sigma-70 factor, ECF subfamily